MREYIILTATFTVPFILLGLLNYALRLAIRSLGGGRSVPSVKSVLSVNPITTERR